MKPMHLAALLLIAGSAHATYSVGSTPPDFTCNTTRPDLHGTSWNLYSQHGKVVMINFGAVWCGPCNAEFPYLQSQYETGYDPAVFELVHIDVDNEPASYLNNHWQQYGITFPLLMGCGSLFPAWGSGSIPHTVVLDPNGIVRGNWIGFSTADIPVIQGVIETWLPSVSPLLSVDGFAVSLEDDGDGRVEPGETASMALRLENAPFALPALATTATLSSTNGSILLVVDEIEFPLIGSGSAVDGPTEFVFTVDDLAGVFQAGLTLTLSSTYPGGAQPHVIQLPVAVPVGWPDWLVVDSDGTADDNENWITAAFENLSLPFDLHAPAQGAVDAALLSHYPRVLWAGGIDTGDISVSEAAALAAYMDGGGRLLVSSQHGLNNAANAGILCGLLPCVTGPEHGHQHLPHAGGGRGSLLRWHATAHHRQRWRRQQPGSGPLERPRRVPPRSSTGPREPAVCPVSGWTTGPTGRSFSVSRWRRHAHTGPIPIP
jgi:thiol-disulfide isomerase/thioredoxin